MKPLFGYTNFVNIQADTFKDKDPQYVLKKVFGYDDFRMNQKQIIESVLAKKDTLCIMPTGGGKSLCYQIPALIMSGVTVVVSPLISLMQDQVAALVHIGVPCVFLNSALDWEEYQSNVEDIKAGLIKLIYVSPEGLASSKIRELLSEVEVSLVTIDEAHCVSQWGHDFRPDYLDICYVRRLFPKAVMLALTATATEAVRKDIAKNLELKKPAVFISSFNRPNIVLQVQPKRDGPKQVYDFLKAHSGQSGIIYCNSRRQVDELYRMLDGSGFSVLPYHAGLTDEVRAENQKKFVSDKVAIMVATVAFGMGINKANVRFVINFDLPKSLEEYYQEIGRAGRDGEPSVALMLFGMGDIHKIRFLLEQSEDKNNGEQLLQSIIKYATARTCRRKILLGYFGEEYDGSVSPECCCDACTRGVSMDSVDVTIPVQKFLSCMIRTGERFGANYVIDVLLGSRDKRIRDNNHNMLSTWGIGCELCKDDWFNLVEQLLEQRFIRKEGDYGVLKLASRAHEVLATREKIFMNIELTGPHEEGSSLMLKKPVLHKKGSRKSVKKTYR